MKRAFFILLILFVQFSATVFAQSDSVIIQDKPQFKLGVYYNSNLNYYGRTDSLKSSGVFPVAEFWINKKFYITAAPIFISNALTSLEYTGSVATAGMRLEKKKKSISNIYLVKPLYKRNSQQVQSALKAQVVATHSWQNKIANITIGGDVKLSDQLDYGVTAGLDHILRFELPGQSVLVFNPSAYINAGTQQFTKTSYKQNGFLFFPGAQQELREEVNKFNILSYEFSMPVVFAKGKVLVIANPAFVMPQNLISVSNRPDLSERGENMFYITVGAKVNF